MACPVIIWLNNPLRIILNICTILWSIKIKLTSKQKIFIVEYLRDFNGSRAAINAGYSKKSARQIASKMLANVNISKALNFEIAKIHDTQRKSLIRASDLAIKALIDVVEHGSGSARVSAANSILDRSGHRASDKLHDELNDNLKLEDESESIEARRERVLQKLLPMLSNKVNNCGPGDTFIPQHSRDM